MEQLKYSGIFEAVTIRKSGYPFRYSHELFWKRFKCLVSGIDTKNLKETIIQSYPRYFYRLY